jgi:hypothetical protein
MEAAEAVIEKFARIARPMMREYMSADSCISAARTTVETMRLCGLRAVEIPVSFIFQVPVREYARLSGLSTEEYAEAKAKAKAWKDLTHPDGKGWDGHLIVLVERRWILDPAIDQADAPEFGVSVPPEVFFFDSSGQDWNPRENFHMELKLVLDNGDDAQLIYRSTSDRSYRTTEAWADEGLSLLAHLIATEMNA